ncbi:MAG: hypothetical protein ACKO4Q_15730, partial [Planctomycetota bacterium]
MRRKSFYTAREPVGKDPRSNSGTPRATLRAMKLTLSALLALLVSSCVSTPSVLQIEAQEFLDRYTRAYVGLYAAGSEAQWASQTRIVEGDDTNAKRTQAAEEATAAFTGSIENIETAQRLLAGRAELTDLQVRQLEGVLFRAASGPQTQRELVKRRIAAETAQVEKLYGFTFRLDGKEVSANEIDGGLKSEPDLARRRAVWECSK